MSNKTEWIISEAALDGLYPTEQLVERVLAGEQDVGDPALEDYIQEVGLEWDNQD